MKSKIKLSRELMFVLGMLLLPFSVTLCTKANLGMSMIAAPTYIVSERISWLSYGQAEYIFQAIVLAVMCMIIGKFKWSYLTSFLSALIYGTVLDFYIWLLRDWSVDTIWMRLLVFAGGIIFCAIGVSFFMCTYLAPCAYDYLVRMVVEVRGFPLRKTKLTNDFVYLVLSVVLSLILFHGFVGVTWGTFVIAGVNGILISAVSNFFKSHIELFDHFPKLANWFE